MKTYWMILATVGIVITIIGANKFFYIVTEMNQAVVTQFGEPIDKPSREAGLYFKLPWQKVHLFEKRLLRWDGDPREIVTKDKKYIFIDTTARWRITDPLKFFQAVRNIPGAQTRLDDVIDSNIRNFITQYPLIEIVRSTKGTLKDLDIDEDNEQLSQEFKDLLASSSQEEVVKVGRDEIMAEVLARSAATAGREYGIEIVDIKIQRINYIEEVREKVYERMISERKRIAEKYRSEGQGERAKLLGLKEKELDRIRSEAYKVAKEIEGEGDAAAIQIYANAYGRDPEFYSFLNSLESFKETFGNNTKLVLSTKNDFYKYLKRIQ